MVDGKPTSLLDLGYSRAGLDGGWEGCGLGVNGSQHTIDGTPIPNAKFPDLKGMVAKGHALGLLVGFYLNTCICMEKGRTNFEQDVAFLKEMDIDTVKIDQCGSAMNMSLWAALINSTGKPMMQENCHNAPSWWSPGANAAKVCDSNMW